MQKLATLSLLMATLLLYSCSQKQNWPQFLGPDNTMIVNAKNLPEEWGNDMNVKWTTDLEGAGWSSPVIWGNRIIIICAVPEKVNPAPERGPGQGPPPGGQAPPPGQAPQSGQMPQPGQAFQPGQAPQGVQFPPRQDIPDTSFRREIYRWEVQCFDLGTGKQLWKQVAYHGAPRAGKNPGSTYACETPVTDGKRIFAYFGMHGLYCYDMDGKLLWQKDFGSYYTQRGWGTGSSPVLYNNILYILNDNEENSFLAALDALTGEELWKVSRDEKTTYSTPYIWRNSVRTELVTTGKTARSYDPATGRLLWQLNMGGEQAIPLPTGDKDHVYLGNRGGREAVGVYFAVKAGASGDITPAEGKTESSGVVWMNSGADVGNATPLLYKGLIYVFGARGEITCLNSLTGEEIYKTRLQGAGAIWASPWAYNDKIWFYNESGVTRAFKAGETYELISENKLDDRFWASVAVTGNNYIFRGVEKLWCIGR